jgi:acetylglutamate kinase
MDQLYVIKVGGNIIDDETKLDAFLSSFAALDGRKILVHGGGKIATKLAADLSIPQQMVDGRRITDAATLKIVTMVYAGLINKSIVAALNAKGAISMGICGADGHAIQAHQRKHPEMDFGFVGDIDSVNAGFLTALLNTGINLVVAPITQDQKGQLLNTNADTIAQEIAKHMAVAFETTLVYSFEKKGVLKDLHDEHSVVPVINQEIFATMKKEKTIVAGMIPKLDNAFAAIRSGVKRVIIGDAMELDQLIAGTTGTSIC